MLTGSRNIGIAIPKSNLGTTIASPSHSHQTPTQVGQGGGGSGGGLSGSNMGLNPHLTGTLPSVPFPTGLLRFPFAFARKSIPFRYDFV